MSAERTFFLWVNSILITLLITSCNRVNPDPPAAVGFDQPIPTPRSYLVGRVTFELADLEKKINDKLSVVLVDKNQLKGTKSEKFDLKVERIGPVKLRYVRQQVFFSAPLRIWVGNPLALRKKNAEAKRPLGVLFVRFKSPVEVNTGWRLSTKSEFVSYKWINRPRLRVLGVSLNVTNLVNKVLEKQRSTIEEAIDQSIQNEVRLERELGNIWRDLQKPILLNKKVDTIWLVPKPVSVAAAPLSGTTKTITVPLRIGFETDIAIGPKPAFKPVKRLPRLERVTELPADTDLHVLSQIKYADINTVLEKTMRKRKIKLAGGAIQVKSASVYGGQNSLIVKTEVGGAVKGTLYFHGKPVFDTLTNTLQVKQVDFDVRTQETLLGTADWLLHDHLRDTLSHVLQIPLDNQIDQIPGKIEEAIDRGKTGQKINLDLRDFIFIPKKIAVRPEGIQVLIVIRSKVRITVKKL